MKRLTHEDGFEWYRTPNQNREIYEKLKYYEDMEEQGKLVLYPRNAYCIVGNEVRKGFVLEVTYCVCRKPLYTVRYDDYSLKEHTGYLGLSVFLTEEEAKEELKELQS